MVLAVAVTVVENYFTVIVEVGCYKLTYTSGTGYIASRLIFLIINEKPHFFCL